MPKMTFMIAPKVLRNCEKWQMP